MKHNKNKVLMRPECFKADVHSQCATSTILITSDSLCLDPKSSASPSVDLLTSVKAPPMPPGTQDLSP